jgi:hypothetical protein
MVKEAAEMSVSSWLSQHLSLLLRSNTKAGCDGLSHFALADHGSAI